MLALWLLVPLLAATPDPAARARALLGREESILDTLEALDQQIAEVARSQASASVRLTELEREQVALEARLTALEAESEDRRVRLRHRLQARTGLDTGAHLRLLLGARDLADLIRFRHDLDRVLRADVDLLQAVRADRARVAATSADKARNAQEIAAAQQSLAERRARLEAERATRGAVLQRIRTERGLQERLAVEREQRREALQAELLAAAPPGTEDLARHRGRLPRPTVGRVTGRFGRREDPETGTVTFAKGVEIDAPVGAPVRAVHSGEVVYAGWYKGFGNVVIIRHGGDWYSLYAHLSAVGKARGERVAQGDPVGEVGDTGSLRGPGLYFELRRRSEAVDPMPWFRSGP